DDFAIGKEPSLLVQFDLTAGDSLAIVRSMTIIDTVPWTVTNALKRAPDGKVYSTSHSYKTNNPALLGAIQLPDLKGKACRFTPTEGLQLQEGTFSFIGLPNTISG